MEEFLIILPVTVAFGGAVLGLIGLLWTLPGVALCAPIARLRNLDVGLYAGAAARCSASGLLPWVYLFSSLILGRRLPAALVMPFFALLYITWLFLIVSAATQLMLPPIAHVFDLDLLGYRRWHSLVPIVLSIVVFGVIVPLSTLTYVLSFRNLWRSYRAAGVVASASKLTPPRNEYLIPFVWLTVWAVILLVATVFVGLTGYIGT